MAWTRNGMRLATANAAAGFLALAAAWFLPHLAFAAVLIGACFFGFSALALVVLWKVPTEDPDIVPAHVAFLQPAVTATPLATPSYGPLPAAKAPADPKVAHLEDEIRLITRQINKAGVRLATGKISEDGYRRLVEGLKEQRAKLEEQRYIIEMQ